MSVQLSPGTEEWIVRLIASGRFADADHVVQSALTHLERDDPEYWEKLEALAAEADSSISQGKLKRIDAAFVEALREKAREASPGSAPG